MNRRQFLELTAGSSAIMAGCSRGNPENATKDTPSKTNPSPTRSPTPTKTPTETNTPTETPQKHADRIYVGPEGTPGDGTKDSPVKSIREALDRAQPGDTIYLKPGQYFESPQTKRSGKPGAPITITGPPDAIISGDPEREYGDGFTILHNHIHLTGVTIDGLQDPSNPDTSESYMPRGIVTMSKEMGEGRENNPEPGPLTDLVIKPNAAGNTANALIVLGHAENVEVGEFKIIGPVGTAFLFEDEIGHFGEIVYVGPGEWPVENVHIHHIDNSAGHDHIGGFPDIKMNARNVLFEYNTTYGARIPSDNDHGTTAHLGGHDCVFRWNRIGSPETRGIDVGNYRQEPPEDFPKAGTQNSIYGNDLKELGGGKAILYTPETSEEKQRHVCGNTTVGETDGNPTKDCPSNLPETETIGHLGGDSPW